MGFLRRSSNHRVYKLWDEVDSDPLVPAGARVASTSAARALYLFGIGGGAVALALGSMLGARVVGELDMSPETKLGALLMLTPPAIGAVVTWISMRALQERVLRAALNKRTTLGASSTTNPSSSAGA